MNRKQKLQLKKATVMLQAATAQANSAWQGVLAAVTLAVEARCYGEAGADKTGEDKLRAQKTATTEWARAAVQSDATFATVRAYVSQAAAVALVPDAVGVIETGPKDKKSRVEVAGAKAIQTRRDLSAVAEAANAAMGIKKKAGSGRKGTESADTPEQAKARAEAEAAALKVSAEAAQRHTLAFHDMVCEALSGKPEQAGHRQALITALASKGLMLAPLAAVGAAADLSQPKGGKAAPKGGKGKGKTDEKRASH
jgi:hypothetical protein